MQANEMRIRSLSIHSHYACPLDARDAVPPLLGPGVLLGRPRSVEPTSCSCTSPRGKGWGGPSAPSRKLIPVFPLTYAKVFAILALSA
jgi:hypothetical protein